MGATDFEALAQAKPSPGAAAVLDASPLFVGVTWRVVKLQFGDEDDGAGRRSEDGDKAEEPPPREDPQGSKRKEISYYVKIIVKMCIQTQAQVCISISRTTPREGLPVGKRKETSVCILIPVKVHAKTLVQVFIAILSLTKRKRCKFLMRLI